MKQIKILAVFALTSLCMVASARGADGVNPAFSAWESFNVGSTATFEGTIDSPQGKMSMNTTTKLVEKAVDHVVVQVSQSMTIAGQSHSGPPHSETIQKATDPGKEVTQIGTEDVAVAGKTFSCKIYVAAHPTDAKGEVKMWATSQVPGGAVKIEFTGHGTQMSMILKSFEVK